VAAWEVADELAAVVMDDHKDWPILATAGLS
jgi:3-deoxy-D-manno-octulosonate 8-phosphate phosphatase KdsC-like HAD superfamily phosphatase